MKYWLVVIILVQASVAWSRNDNVNDFNQILIQKMQKDLQNDNTDEFKKKEVVRRPASIEGGDKVQPEKKIDKQKQIGSPKW